MKAVIVYFSYSGNTKRAAEQIAAVTGAPTYRIEPVEPYTDADVDWTVETARNVIEHKDRKARPAIKPLDIDFTQYDTVFIGFPIWWYEEPAVIRTFLDTYDLSGKTLYPFCTSGGSPMSQGDDSLKKGYPTLNWHQGLKLPADPKTITEWINK